MQTLPLAKSKFSVTKLTIECCGHPPFQLDDENLSENVRLLHRVIDLRRPQMQNNMILRYKKQHAHSAASFDDNGFIDIETPMLINRPRKARVTTWFHLAFILTVLLPFHNHLSYSNSCSWWPVTTVTTKSSNASVTRICGLTASQSSQVDIETSFMTEEDITGLIEKLICYVFKDAINVDLPSPFPRMSYAEAMLRFGSDKPDLRVTLELTEVTDVVKDVAFKVFSGTANSANGRVALQCEFLEAPVSPAVKLMNTKFVSIYGARVWPIKVNDVTQLNETGLQSPIVKNIHEKMP